MKLNINEFEKFHGCSEALSLGSDSSRGEGNSDLIELMEQFAARLGKDSVLKVRTTPSYCPELAIKQLRYDQIGSLRIEQEIISSTPRPFMLLQNPRELTVKDWKLYNQEIITM